MVKHKIIIDEPSRFIEFTDNNIVSGVILGVLSSKHIVFKSDNLLHFEGLAGRYLLLKIQYGKRARNAKDKNAVAVEVALILVDTYSLQDEQYLEDNSKYITTGTLTMN